MKTKSLLFASTILSCITIAIVSCSKDPESVSAGTNKLQLPTEKYDYVGTSSEIATLGRVLFYDKTLSINNAVSCGSCHRQELAFADNKRFSRGFESRSTPRNTPAIQNIAVTGQSLFWDGREHDLKNMVLKPVFNHLEMGMSTPSEITNKVAKRAYYPQLFADAFGSDEINFERIAEALTGFVGSIRSDRSKFDMSPADKLSPREQRGMDLFFGKYNCGSCHNLFNARGYSFSSGNEMINIGLDANYADKGMGDLTNNPEDNGKFKIPNLHNIALTAPYMHDGRFESLEEVMNHYSSGIQNHPNLSPQLKDNFTGIPLALNITEQDKKDMIAFLETLTDHHLLTDPRFSDPFKSH